MTKKQVVAYCYEGLANRLDTLITAAFIAKRFNIPLNFFWMQNCISNEADVDDLFERVGAKRLDEADFLEFVDTNAPSMFAMARNISRIGSKVQLYSCEAFSCNVSLVDLDMVDKEIIFVQCCTIAPWASNKQGIQSFYNFFSPRKELYKKPLSSVAIHIRGTDMLEDQHVKGASLDHAVAFAHYVSKKHPGSKIFVCTDDSKVAMALQRDPFVHFEKEYVMKRDETKQFNDGIEQNGLGVDYQTLDTFEHQGKKYKNIVQTNLVRTKNQVVGGLIDLLALSHVEHLYGYETSKFSTFFILASLLKQCNAKHIL